MNIHDYRYLKWSKNPSMISIGIWLVVMHGSVMIDDHIKFKQWLNWLKRYACILSVIHTKKGSVFKWMMNIHDYNVHTCMHSLCYNAHHHIFSGTTIPHPQMSRNIYTLTNSWLRTFMFKMSIRDQLMKWPLWSYCMHNFMFMNIHLIVNLKIIPIKS